MGIAADWFDQAAIGEADRPEIGPHKRARTISFPDKSS
jgi:hypothetical protein